LTIITASGTIVVTKKRNGSTKGRHEMTKQERQEVESQKAINKAAVVRKDETEQAVSDWLTKQRQARIRALQDF